MTSQVELLKESVARLEPVHGPDNPFVKGLKQQIAGLESQSARAQEREQFNLAVNSLSSRAPEPEDRAAAALYESLISALPNDTESPETAQPASPESTIQESLAALSQVLSTAQASKEQKPEGSPDQATEG